jgi:hypothetical protein
MGRSWVGSSGLLEAKTPLCLAIVSFAGTREIVKAV